MKNLFLIPLFLLLGSCQLQINLASSVINIPVVKAQYESDKADMSGSQLDDIAKGATQDTKPEIKVVP